MLDTMLDLFYLFILVAGTAGLGAVKRAGRKFFTSDAPLWDGNTTHVGERRSLTTRT